MTSVQPVCPCCSPTIVILRSMRTNPLMQALHSLSNSLAACRLPSLFVPCLRGMRVLVVSPRGLLCMCVCTNFTRSISLFCDTCQKRAGVDHASTKAATNGISTDLTMSFCSCMSCRQLNKNKFTGGLPEEWNEMTSMKTLWVPSFQSALPLAIQLYVCPHYS
jgi:hypothetical protein